jgi:ATP-dependent RNA helicase DDX10/DBP4
MAGEDRSDADSDAEPPRKKPKKWFQDDSDDEAAKKKSKSGKKKGGKVFEMDQEPETLEDLETLAAGLLDG